MVIYRMYPQVLVGRCYPVSLRSITVIGQYWNRTITVLRLYMGSTWAYMEYIGVLPWCTPIFSNVLLFTPMYSYLHVLPCECSEPQQPTRTIKCRVGAAGASRASLALSLSLSKDLQATRVVSNLSLSLRYLELTKSAPPTLTAGKAWTWIELNWILTFNACAGKFELDLKMQKV